MLRRSTENPTIGASRTQIEFLEITATVYSKCDKEPERIILASDSTVFYRSISLMGNSGAGGQHGEAEGKAGDMSRGGLQLHKRVVEQLAEGGITAETEYFQMLKPRSTKLFWLRAIWLVRNTDV